MGSDQRARGPAVHRWRVRPEQPADASAIARVHWRAFEGSVLEGRLVEAIRASASWQPALSFVAESGSEVVGHVLLSPVRLRDGEEEHGALVLAPLGVLPEWQRQGIGSALVRESIVAARACGQRAIVLVGHPTYYARFGFESAAAYGIVQPFPAGDASMILFLDPEARGTVRGAVEYSAAFHAVPGLLP